MLDLNKMNIGDLLQLCAKLGQVTGAPACSGSSPSAGSASPIPVVVCTDKRGVVFGYTSDPHARPIAVSDARMCLFWSSNVGGVFGLADIGPTKECKISATAPSLTLEGVTAVFSMTEKAVTAWKSAPIQGR